MSDPQQGCVNCAHGDETKIEAAAAVSRFLDWAATVLEANAAMSSIVRWDTGEGS
ncbi:MAG: hypothetical protein ABSG23_06570 [Terriglobales bacterium]